MKKAIRQVLHEFPAGFSRKPTASQPLESDNYPRFVVNEHDKMAIPSFNASVETPCAVIDTGCQRSAIGRNTLNRLIQHLPTGLSIRFQPKSYRFSGIGGETVTKELALIPVCFGSRPGVVCAAVLEDTADAPFLLSLPIMKELDAVLHLNEQRMHFQSLQESGKLFFNERGQLCLRLFDFDSLAPECHQPNRTWKPKKIVGDECQAEVKQQVHQRWGRVFTRLRIQMHLEQVVKVLMSLAIPLMSTLKQVLAVMIRVADPEEMDVVQDMVNNMVQEKKYMEKGKPLKPSKMSPGYAQSRASTSVGSFEVISENSSMSRKTKAASSSQSSAVEISQRMCFCGLTPNLLVCRKEGPNFQRKFYRCPKPYQHQAQCDYFAWAESTKAEEYEKMYHHQNASMEMQQKPKSTKKKSKHVSEAEYVTSGDEDSELAQSPVTSSPSPKTPPRPRMCQHEWNRRGTNAYVKMKTCHLCGLQETFRYRDGVKTTTTIDVSNLKKSGRRRAVSP
eukprot:s170_g10.t1